MVWLGVLDIKGEAGSAELRISMLSVEVSS